MEKLDNPRTKLIFIAGFLAYGLGLGRLFFATFNAVVQGNWAETLLIGAPATALLVVGILLAIWFVKRTKMI